MKKEDRTGLDRRDLFRLGAAGVGGLAAHSLAAPVARASAGEATRMDAAVRPLDGVRIGFVGVGWMGTAHVENFL